MDLIDQVVELQKKYKEIYDVEGFELAGISRNYVQLMESTFLKYFKEYNVNKLDIDDVFQLEYWTEYNDVKFLCLSRGGK